MTAQSMLSKCAVLSLDIRDASLSSDREVFCFYFQFSLNKPSNV